MSAFLCSDLHISVIASALAELPDDVQQLANALKSINIDSINYRYRENSEAEACNIETDGKTYSEADIAALVACWNYQACEGDTWPYRVMSSYLTSRCNALGIERGDSVLWSI